MSAILEEYFYNGTIRTYTSVFGSLFNKIKIKKSGKLVAVPIQYQMKNKQNERREKADPTDKRIESILPRMSFNLVAINRDPSRQKNPYGYNTLKTTSSTGVVSGKRQMMRVPYTFQYELAIKTKYVEEMYQILEQILVWFTDSITIVIKDDTEFDGETGCTLALSGTNPENVFEGSFEDFNQVETTLTFNLNGYLYRPSTSQGFIEKVIVKYHSYTGDDIDDNTLFEVDTITESGVTEDYPNGS